MKKIIFLIFVFLLGAGISFADESHSESSIIWTSFVNIVDESFRFPLIGFVNIARGSHRLPQLGFINLNENNFYGFQGGFLNIVGGNFSGAQLSFLNIVGDNFNGLQGGFLNIAGGNFSGVQLSFLNGVGDNFSGLQAAFLNIVGDNFSGVQLSFLNGVGDNFNGFQGGFLNIVGGNFSGVQLGFINYVDNIESGIPIGFISIVRNGGYRAIEYSFSEFYPINLGFKIGVEKFYTTIIAAYNPSRDFSLEQFAFGAGAGSILSITNSFFFNPELNSLSASLSDGDPQFLSFVPYFGFNINKSFSVTAGPSVTWVWSNGSKQKKPFFQIYENTINNKNSIVIGMRAAMRFRF